MHGRERRRGPRPPLEEVVPQIRVEGIADAEGGEVAQGRVHGGCAVSVARFEGPVDADVAVLCEGELCCAGGGGGSGEGRGWREGAAGVGPGWGLAGGECAG